ncbi:MAG: low molecular weight protein-tyrosine-phosphatase [Candidatus Accumulibacter meliphilus]|uniref:low molecular weight protein-tyrosine-phosphatase n=1 Tax=Candidatus Accumulibacter meliphilus TaxID=2211374 RepID=UPI002FC3877A
MSKTATPPRYRILFVCMGNICRSPLAAAVTRGLAQREGLGALLETDSAGTHGHYHAGEAPDPRARKVGAKRGYDLSKMRARPVVVADFERFDRILAMDHENMANLLRLCPEESRAKLGMFLDYVPESRPFRRSRSVLRRRVRIRTGARALRTGGKGSDRRL